MDLSRVIAVWLLVAPSACLPSAMQPRVSYAANPQALQSTGFVIFQDSTGALSYHAPVGRDVRKLVSTQRVRGRACQRGIQLPIEPLLAAVSGSPSTGPASLSAFWGEGGYRDAMDDARRGLPRDAVLFDVRADLSTLVVLSVYRQRCVLLDAAVALPMSATEIPPPTASQSSEAPPSAAD